MILIWIGVIFSVATLLGAGADVPTTWTAKIRGYFISFLSLTLPVMLYGTLSEGLAGRTLGKHVLGLRVEPPQVGAAATRNFFKFAQWELAHAGIWLVPGQPFSGTMPLLNILICTAGLVIGIGYSACLFLTRTGRTPYDLIAGTRVKRADL